MPNSARGGHAQRAASDAFASLLRRFDLKSRVFFTGKLCSAASFAASPGMGHLHLLRRGRLEVASQAAGRVVLDEPSLVFFPRATPHGIGADEHGGADVVCARVEFGAKLANPLVDALPEMLVLPLKDLLQLQGVLDALFAEAFAAEPGRDAAIDRLCEVVLLHMLRHALKSGLLQGGVMAALTDVRLGKAMLAIHQRPGEDWTLDGLAELAGMSRARFAASFNAVVGTPPAEYLALWRMTLAQGLLIRGRALKSIADEVGYGSGKALARAFTQRVGLSPTDWLASRAAS